MMKIEFLKGQKFSPKWLVGVCILVVLFFAACDSPGTKQPKSDAEKLDAETLDAETLARLDEESFSISMVVLPADKAKPTDFYGIKKYPNAKLRSYPKSLLKSFEKTLVTLKGTRYVIAKPTFAKNNTEFHPEVLFFMDGNKGIDYLLTKQAEVKTDVVTVGGVKVQGAKVLMADEVFLKPNKKYVLYWALSERPGEVGKVDFSTAALTQWGTEEKAPDWLDSRYQVTSLYKEGAGNLLLKERLKNILVRKEEGNIIPASFRFQNFKKLLIGRVDRTDKFHWTYENNDGKGITLSVDSEYAPIVVLGTVTASKPNDEYNKLEIYSISSASFENVAEDPWVTAANLHFYIEHIKKTTFTTAGTALLTYRGWMLNSKVNQSKFDKYFD